MSFKLYSNVDRETMTTEICNSNGQRIAIKELYHGYIELPNEMYETKVRFATRDHNFNRVTKGTVARVGYIYKADFLHPQTGELLTMVWSQVDNSDTNTTFQPLTEIRYDRQNRKSIIELSMPGGLSLIRLSELPTGIQNFVSGYDNVVYQPNPDNYVTTVDSVVAYVKLPDGTFLPTTNIPCKWYCFEGHSMLLGEGVTAYTESEWRKEVTPVLPSGWYDYSYYHNQNNESDESNYPHLYLNGIEWKPQDGVVLDGIDVILLPRYEVTHRRKPNFFVYPYYYNPTTVKIVECLPSSYDDFHPKPRQKPVLVKKEKVVYSSNNANDSDSPFAMLAKLKK